MTNSVMKKLFSAPFVAFILCGTLVPMGVIAWYGLTDRSGAFTVENVAAMFGGDHAKALGLSLALSLISTAICLLLAFPLGLLLRDSGLGKKGFMVFLFILPMWMNFLLRTMAWQVLLEKGGILNTILGAFGLPALEMINTPTAVVLGMVYDYLPFMVLPIYNALSKIDSSLIEAAYDLGASKSVVLRRILIPLSVPGIVSGVTMVFVPSLTTFAISNMLGGGKVNLIGNIIEQEFTSSSNWNLGSGLSLVMMIFIVISMALIEKFDRNGEGNLI
ncbi:MAG: ABC transporter permease [Firmicutes bacterium]|nr:ABC transporter permease [Bacillota bacterium]MDD7602125.1 ABC transporter permease [Bacillota bacterium]MDY5856968.1 ABC transporter permease [Anaerovoracaceae bacterium]